MNEIQIVCFQEADFLGPHAVLFRVTAEEVGKSIAAPAWIRGTLLFKSLSKEGKISVVKTVRGEQKEIIEESVEEPVKVIRKKASKKKDDAE